ncbi:DUF1269 domain-containing protein [Streptomyces californicus]|uniref:DUF1269 domain-containing protein n=1 Tax=Streptomyces californicus TaxID=67351 RepID=UPI00371C999D
MPEYVAAVTFPDNSTAYQAATKIDAAAGTGAFTVEGAVIIERDSEGRLSIPQADDRDLGAGSIGGGLLGMLVGLLGGPVGMLIGFGAGALTGAAVDSEHIDDADDAVLAFSRSVPAGRNALLLATSEGTTDALDRTVADLGGTIVRKDLDLVLAEIEAENDAADAASRAARKEMREAKKKERKEDRQERINRLKSRHHKHTSDS